MSACFADPIDKRKVKVQVSQSQVGPKAGKQSIEPDYSEGDCQRAEKTVQAAKVNTSKQRADDARRADIWTADDVDQGWSDQNTRCLAYGKLRKIEASPWNVSMSNHDRTCPYVADHSTSGDVHCENGR